MECLGQLVSIVPCLWECSNKHLAYIRHLEDNLNSLSTTLAELNSLCRDVKTRVSEAEEQHMKRTNQVEGWLQRVEAVNGEANRVLEMGSLELERKCVGGCFPKNCRASYKIGKKVMKMLPQVTELLGKGQFDVFADKLPPPPVDELPMDGPVVGFGSKFGEIWRFVQDEDSSIIGLVGAGGVGKTTLLKQLNNELSKTSLGFDLVIWIVVSKQPDLGRIRDTIRSKLNISNNLWENRSEDQRIGLICDKLKGKKFALLLDDLWDKFKLSEVGIPVSQRGVDNASKVVFTTRFEGVGRSLDAHKLIKVGCLPPGEALNLFKTKVGKDVLKSHPELQQLVKDVASECGGLPLALITIGRAMRGKIDAQQWKHAKRMLEKYPATFPDMEGEVFSKLIFSYDCLPTPTIQRCFEYCSIFPEDHEIPKDELIGLWIAEGLIDEYGDMYDARIQGHQIIESLKQSCLLEEALVKWHSEQKESVKMHDVIRDMALWLVCEHGHEKKNKFRVNVIIGDHGMSYANRADRWNYAERVSLWGNITDTTFKSLTESSGFPNLVSLIIKNNHKLKNLPPEVFPLMNVLKVLNLSDNSELSELPAEIGDLVHLEYLNIKETSVRRLPEEVKQLKQLKFLLVSRKTLVSGEVISSLESLQVFENCTFGDRVDVDDEVKAMEGEMLQGLEDSKRVMDLCIQLRSATSMQTMFKSQNLQRCTRLLRLLCENESLPDVLDLSTAGRFMEQLERLLLRECDTSVIKFGSSLSSLREIKISYCKKIRNLSSILYLPNLRVLVVSSCLSMEEVIVEDEVVTKNISLFPGLTHLVLGFLPMLRSICPQNALPFPNLKEMKIGSCYNLIKLPFDSKTAHTCSSELKIYGDKYWWDLLQWDSQTTKNALTPKFQPLVINTDSSMLRRTKFPRVTRKKSMYTSFETSDLLSPW